ncbi:MAG TPA: UbiA family prenyltransferase [Bacteroidia bacterium]|nr:UbiA family prenyltransferase [Bacteroidia bacterium]
MEANTENYNPFLQRFVIYQRERFPVLAHGLLILAFTFSAVSYSRLCRLTGGFIAWQDFMACFWVTFSSFFLLRVADEFKDREDDALHRKYLPVPRGLISFPELKITAYTVLVLQVVVLLAVQPAMWPFYMAILLFLLLMRYEFFVSAWLKSHYMLYALSHMFIIPVIDMYASGTDWYLGDDNPPTGILYFLVVSYLNGLVIEIGRKLRAPGKEEPGVVSYSSLYGLRNAVLLWLLVISLAGAGCFMAMGYAGIQQVYQYLLLALWLVCCIPAALLLKSPTVKGTKAVEKLSAVWTIMMYLLLGGIPMLISLLK